MKATRKTALIAAFMGTVMALAGCGQSSTPAATTAGNTTTAAAAETTTQAETETKTEAETSAEGADAEVKTDAAAAPEEDAGFTEIPIFEDEEVGFLNVSAVYFQPVPMSMGNGNTEDYNLHLEADISALENSVGFGVGDWVPYLTVDYIISKDGTEVTSGTFMEMSASDGPHYGANVKLPDTDTYSLKFIIHSPEENGYLVHTDSETGPGGTFDDYFKDGNLEVTYDGWDYIQQW